MPTLLTHPAVPLALGLGLGRKVVPTDINERLADLDRATLKRAAELQAERQAQQAAPEMARSEQKAEAAPAWPGGALLRGNIGQNDASHPRAPGMRAAATR